MTQYCIYCNQTLVGGTKAEREQHIKNCEEIHNKRIKNLLIEVSK